MIKWFKRWTRFAELLLFSKPHEDLTIEEIDRGLDYLNQLKKRKLKDKTND